MFLFYFVVSETAARAGEGTHSTTEYPTSSVQFGPQVYIPTVNF